MEILLKFLGWMVLSYVYIYIYIWSNYSDLTRPHPKWWFSKGNPLISGKSRLVKYYNLARYIYIYILVRLPKKLYKNILDLSTLKKHQPLRLEVQTQTWNAGCEPGKKKHNCRCVIWGISGSWYVQHVPWQGTSAFDMSPLTDLEHFQWFKWEMFFLDIPRWSKTSVMF